MKIFPLRSGRQQDYPISPILDNIVLEVLEIEGIQIEKRQTKLSLFTDDMILYIEHSKDATRNILKLISEFGKFADRKSVHRNLFYFYTLAMKDQKEEFLKIPLTVASKIIKIHAQYWMLGAGALGRPRRMEWGGRREEGSGWGTHVYLWRIHFDIWQN